MLNRLTKRERTLLITTITVVSAAVGYTLIINPLTNKWRDLNNQIIQKSTKLNNNLVLLEKEGRIKEEFKKYAEYTKSSGSDEEAIASLLKTIEEKSTLTSTHITNIRPKPIKDTGFYKEFVFEVITESGLDELMRFIYELQNSKELLKVKKLTLTLKSSQSKTLKGIMEITKVSVKPH